MSLLEVSREAKLVVGLVGVSHFINHMYLVLLPPIFGILAVEFDVGLAALGLAVGVQGLVNTAFQLPFGYLSDNHSRTITLGIGLGLGALGVFVLAAAPSYEWLLVGQAVLGVGIAAHHPAHFPLLADATDEQYRGRVFSLHGFSGNMGYAAAPAIIIAVLSLPGTTWRTAFLLIGIVGGTYALLCTVLLAWRVDDHITVPAPDPSEDENPFDSVGQRILTELGSLFSSPGILALATLALVTSMASWGIRSYAVVLLTDGYGFRLDAANVALTVMFVASAILILLGGELSDRISAGTVILSSFALLVVSAAGVASFLIPPVAALAFVVITGSAISLGMPARSKLTDRLSARNELGMNFALITVGVTTAGAAAPPFFGAVIDRNGFGVAFFIIAALGVLGALLAGVILRRLRRTGNA